MQPQTELMLNLKDIAEKEIGISLNLTELPKDGGLYAELGSGSQVKRYLRAGTGIYRYPVLIMCKRKDEPRCIEELSKISNYFKTCKRLPDGKVYQFRSAKIGSEPGKAGRQEDGQVIYSCIMNFEIYY